MLLLRRLVPLALLAGALAACGGDPSGPGGKAPSKIEALPRALSPGEQLLVAASNSFSSSLLREVNRDAYADSNIFVSPLSASMALGMTMNGTAGETYDEMRTSLGFGQLSREEILRSYRDLITLLRALDPKVDFRIANAIWYRDTFGPAIEPTFLDEARDFFDAKAQGLDFASPAAVTAVNQWADASTNGRIKRVIDKIDDELVMLLANAIYFKGDWRQAFKPANTRPGTFTTHRGTQVQVPMMSRMGTARVARVGGRTVVELGYGGDAFAMTVVLPAEGESVNTLADALTPQAWSTLTAALLEGDVDLTLPKFTLKWEKFLNEDLQAMGMQRAFRPGVADFTRLSSRHGRELYIDFVKQNTFVDVNEVGTEAAAVTVVGIGIVSLPQRTVVRVDRPFVFAIRERLSGTVLFMGKVVDPTR